MDARPRPTFLLAVLWIGAALPLLSLIASPLLFRVSPRLAGPSGWLLTKGLESVLTLVAVIAFMVFIYRVFKGMRASGRQTNYSPGLAVGSWFIPLANLVMPALAVAEAYRLRTGKGAGIVALWWVGYWSLPFARMAVHLMSINGGMLADLGVDPYWVYTAASWGLTAVTVGTFVVWATIVSRIARADA